MSSVPTMIGASSPADEGRTTSVGQAACWETHRLTEPRSRLRMPPRPRDPTTTTEAWCEARCSASRASSSLTETVTVRSGN